MYFCSNFNALCVVSLLAASNNHIFDQLAEKKQTFFRQFTFLPWRVMGLWMNNAFSHPLYFGLAEKKVSWKKKSLARTIHPTPVSRWQKSRFHEQAIKFKYKKGQNMTIEFFVNNPANMVHMAWEMLYHIVCSSNIPYCHLWTGVTHPFFHEI